MWRIAQHKECTPCRGRNHHVSKPSGWAPRPQPNREAQSNRAENYRHKEIHTGRPQNDSEERRDSFVLHEQNKLHPSTHQRGWNASNLPESACPQSAPVSLNNERPKRQHQQISKGALTSTKKKWTAFAEHIHSSNLAKKTKTLLRACAILNPHSLGVNAQEEEDL